MFKEEWGQAQTESRLMNIDADSIQASLWVGSLSGTLDVTIYTLTEDGKETSVISFPQVTAASGSLQIRKAAAIMSRIRVEVVASDAADFEVRIRGIGTGEASVRILAANEAKASQEDIGTGTPTLIVPAALNDRAGFVIKNNNSGAGEILYIGFTSGETTTTNGYPIGPQESLGVDVASGQEVYGLGTVTIDARLLEASS